MQSIINSIVKNRNLIIYIFLSLITFNFLYQKSPIHSTNIGKIATFISGTSSSFSSSVSSYFSLRSKNQKLITENLELKKVESKYNILSQNTENLSILSGPITSAEVILNSVNKNKNIIVINKGLSEGVNKEMGVISSNGIVGIVKNVTDNYSSIISLLNIDLKINAILKKSSTLGSICSFKKAGPSEGSNDERFFRSCSRIFIIAFNTLSSFICSTLLFFDNYTNLKK